MDKRDFESEKNVLKHKVAEVVVFGMHSTSVFNFKTSYSDLKKETVFPQVITFSNHFPPNLALKTVGLE